jgi:hypothetical protein
MKQIVKLTKEKTDSVHVDDVDVSKGIKATDRDHHGVAFVFKSEPGYYIRWTCSHGTSFNFDSLSEMVSSLDCSFFTLDGRRITTERELTVDDLQNTDHVGWIDTYGCKWECILVLGGKVNSICRNHSVFNDKYQLARSSDTETIAESLEFSNAKEVYLFTGENAAKELYKWLSE